MQGPLSLMCADNYDNSLIDIGGSGDEVNMNLLCQPDSNNENDLNDIKSESEDETLVNLRPIMKMIISTMRVIFVI